MAEETSVLTHNMKNQEDEAFDIKEIITACQHGKLEIVDQALRKGFKVDFYDEDGCSLLHWAAINNRIEIAQRLLQYNADPNILGGVLCSTPVHWAARNGLVKMCALLVKHGAVCDIRDVQGYTPVHLAIQGSHVPLVAYFLLKFHYTKDIMDNSGMTPAMWCAYRSFTMFPLRLILKTGADLTLVEHLSGNTALHIAAQERNSTAVVELLEAGASVSARNRQQESPLDVARATKNQKIIDLMEDAGRKQGAIRTNCFRKSFVLPYSAYFFFILPALVLLGMFAMFKLVPFFIALGTTFFGSIIVMIMVKFDFNAATYRYLPFGITIAEAFMMVFSWCAYAHWYVPWWAQVLFAMSVIMLGFSLTRMTLLNPGIVKPPKNAKEQFLAQAENCLDSNPNYCFSCFIVKSPHTKHCAVCDHCVINFDHHCPWLDRCITRRNMREFILFILSVFFSSTIYFAATCHYIFHQIQEHGLEDFLTEQTFLFVTIVLAFTHSMMLFGLFVVQINQISMDTTTNQKIKARRARHSGKHSHSHNDHDVAYQNLGATTRCRNVLEFCASNGDRI